MCSGLYANLGRWGWGHSSAGVKPSQLRLISRPAPKQVDCISVKPSWVHWDVYYRASVKRCHLWCIQVPHPTPAPPSRTPALAHIAEASLLRIKPRQWGGGLVRDRSLRWVGGATGGGQMATRLPDLSVCSGLIVSRFPLSKAGFVFGVRPLNCLHKFDRWSDWPNGESSQVKQNSLFRIVTTLMLLRYFSNMLKRTTQMIEYFSFFC